METFRRWSDALAALGVTCRLGAPTVRAMTSCQDLFLATAGRLLVAHRGGPVLQSQLTTDQRHEATLAVSEYASGLQNRGAGRLFRILVDTDRRLVTGYLLADLYASLAIGCWERIHAYEHADQGHLPASWHLDASVHEREALAFMRDHGDGQHEAAYVTYKRAVAEHRASELLAHIFRTAAAAVCRVDDLEQRVPGKVI